MKKTQPMHQQRLTIAPRLPGIVSLAGVLGICLCVGCATGASHHSHANLLSLPYQQFDQTPGSGWRSLSDRNEYREAARVIEAYLRRNTTLPADQQVILHFHAAQAFAFAEDTPAALAHLEHATLDIEPPDTPVRWNDYVLATQAFLKHDHGQLLAARDRIANGPLLNGEIPNLKIVDALLSNFEKPYAVAYRASG